ncbi:MAG: hypothetical protein ACRDTX_05370 [Pseudonocardiaceae bacterium]
MGRSTAFALVAYAFAVTMLGTTLPTPLYPIYQQRIGFSGFVVTVIYAVYAVGVPGCSRSTARCRSGCATSSIWCW